MGSRRGRAEPGQARNFGDLCGEGLGASAPMPRSPASLGLWKLRTRNPVRWFSTWIRRRIPHRRKVRRRPTHAFPRTGKPQDRAHAVHATRPRCPRRNKRPRAAYPFLALKVCAWHLQSASATCLKSTAFVVGREVRVTDMPWDSRKQPFHPTLSEANQGPKRLKPP